MTRHPSRDSVPLRLDSSATPHRAETTRQRPNRSQRVILLTPTPQDAHVCGNILRDVNIESHFCASIEQFCQEIIAESGAALIAQEYLINGTIEVIKQTLKQQPAWSDFPLLVLLKAGEHSSSFLDQILTMGHVTLITRPLRIAPFVNTLRARLRDRERQYTVRDLLHERQKAMETSRQDSLRIEMALRAGGMGAWEIRNGQVYWSPKMFDLMGYPPDFTASLDAAFDRVHPDDLDEFKQYWSDAQRRGEPFQHEFRIQHPTRGIRWIAAVGEPVKSKSGKVLRHTGLNWDITERREYEHSLEEASRHADVANQSKSAFLANMSHEIRTPMTAILGYTDLIATAIGNQETLEHVRTIRRNGEFLLEIINDILDLSKIEAGKFEIALERFATSRLVDDVRSIMELRAAEGGLALDVEYRGEIPAEIESDPKRLKQILINLVGNAIKFTKQGHVKLVVKFASNVLQFDIIDTGIGMTEAQQRRLFQPFSQGDHRVNREFGGTGLGLAISQRLANMLGGNIQVTSEAGQGSKLTVNIAVSNTEHVEFVKPHSIVETVVETHLEVVQLDCHVLVVDDRRDIRFLSRKFLSDAGATVCEAEDGEEAVATVTSAMQSGRAFDIVVLDMQMPKLDGYETAKALRKLGYSGPIIALTADAMQGDMSRCIECGCNDYLSKPIDKALLRQKVAEMTSSFRQHRS
jgi:two-component system CheB/CheR fusion protein